MQIIVMTVGSPHENHIASSCKFPLGEECCKVRMGLLLDWGFIAKWNIFYIAWKNIVQNVNLLQINEGQFASYFCGNHNSYTLATKSHVNLHRMRSSNCSSINRTEVSCSCEEIMVIGIINSFLFHRPKIYIYIYNIYMCVCVYIHIYRWVSARKTRLHWYIVHTRAIKIYLYDIYIIYVYIIYIYIYMLMPGYQQEQCCLQSKVKVDIFCVFEDFKAVKSVLLIIRHIFIIADEIFGASCVATNMF